MEGFGSWSVLTTNFLIVLYLALNGVTLAALLHLANAQWRYKVRYFAVATAGLFPVAFVLLCILLINGESTFQWLAHAHDGEHHMPGWHNYTFLVVREVLGFFAIAGLYGLFIKYQHESVIDSSYEAQRRFRNVAMLIPVAYVLYATMVAWDFEMTQIPNWHSASYGAYHFVSNFHLFLAFFATVLYFLMRSGKAAKEIPPYVLNFLAQFMLAMTILWTYLYFTQYLIIWYGRLPEEMSRFVSMMTHELSPVWWTFLALKFVIPFCSLIFARVRHTPALIVGVACSIMLGSWLERYTWISGSVPGEFHRLPMTSFMDLVYTVAVFGAAFVALRWSYTRFGLVKQS
ncbi:MAG: hypothetical protein OEW58_04465 [Gammaproteobacteria bacterium]|nr:hypothetical protein [Gammaproteobacteria bacterium]